MNISVMITTRNRGVDLERTLRKMSGMNPLPSEILITADGCTDNTVDIIRREIPSVRLWINSEAIGSVASRDAMLRAATGDLVVSLDDDSYPLDSNFFGQLPDLFTAHPEAAVITFPELRDNGVFASSTKTTSSPGHYVSAYPNCAAVMRRDFYLNQPGFPLFFRHMYEETDYALQCYAAGAAVWFDPTLSIRHHLSDHQRQPILRHHQNARNELWSVWMRCPFPQILAVSLFRIWRQFRYAFSEGFAWMSREPVWWFAALLGIPKCWKNRKPIRWCTYYAWMRLARNPVASYKELKAKL